jgi:hypothetical protein
MRKHQPSQPAGHRWLATAAAVNGSASFPAMFRRRQLARIAVSAPYGLGQLSVRNP